VDVASPEQPLGAEGREQTVEDRPDRRERILARREDRQSGQLHRHVRELGQGEQIVQRRERIAADRHDRRRRHAAVVDDDAQLGEPLRHRRQAPQLQRQEEDDGHAVALGRGQQRVPAVLGQQREQRPLAVFDPRKQAHPEQPGRLPQLAREPVRVADRVGVVVVVDGGDPVGMARRRHRAELGIRVQHRRVDSRGLHRGERQLGADRHRRGRARAGVQRVAAVARVTRVRVEVRPGRDRQRPVYLGVYDLHCSRQLV
jgi:hypothetical protein